MAAESLVGLIVVVVVFALIALCAGRQRVSKRTGKRPKISNEQEPGD